MNIKKLKTLEDLFQKRKTEPVQKGFYTRSQFRKAWGVCEQQANRKIRKYLASGLMETKTFIAKSGMVTRPIPHYRIK
jgi:Fic family protein